MIELLLALAAGVGVWLLVIPATKRKPKAHTPVNELVRRWLAQAGLPDVRFREFAVVSFFLGVVGAAGGFLLFATATAALFAAVFCASFPFAAYRARRERRISKAREEWPRMIEEIRVLATSAGKSIPQAFLEVGRRGPVDFRPAFAAAEREWLLSTDFERATSTLKRALQDPSADSVCETLLVAHQIGGGDLASHLSQLAADRHLDMQHRGDERAKQAGVRFARRFVLFVPLGMAAVGLSIGNGREAYATAGGQIGVLAGLMSLAACWFWAGRLLRLPPELRVLHD